MGWRKEFKDFALKGNMMDLAIGVILALAFGKVVNSLVSDILMPPIGLLLEGVDFSALSIKLSNPISTLQPVEIKYGIFINSIISFLIVAFAIFLVVKGMNKISKPTKETPLTKECPECLMAVPIKAKKCSHCCSTLQ